MLGISVFSYDALRRGQPVAVAELELGEEKLLFVGATSARLSGCMGCPQSTLLYTVACLLALGIGRGVRPQIFIRFESNSSHFLS